MIEISTIRGCFATQAEGEAWLSAKLKEGFKVTEPLGNIMGFSYSHRLPWECRIERTLES